MTTFSVDVTVTQSKLGPVLEAKHSTTKKDSVMLSIFQGIGLLYQIADEVADRQPRYSHVAIDFFKSRLFKFGLDIDAAELLLSAPNWRTRMHFTWILASRGARAEALKLDYAVYQNYWPTLEFCEQGWPAKVKRWTKKS